jgi:hypothetical protein
MSGQKWVVFDHANTQAFGPYASPKEAEEDILRKAIENEWPEILEAATHEGWLTDGSTDMGEGEALVLVLLQPSEVTI